MKECLVDVLNERDTVLHVFPIPVEKDDGTPIPVDPEQEALKAAAMVKLADETEILHARPHVSRGGPLTPYADVLEERCQAFERAQQRIRERAFFLWQDEGCPGDRALEHWHRAQELEIAAPRTSWRPDGANSLPRWRHGATHAVDQPDAGALEG